MAVFAPRWKGRRQSERWVYSESSYFFFDSDVNIVSLSVGLLWFVIGACSLFESSCPSSHSSLVRLIIDKGIKMANGGP